MSKYSTYIRILIFYILAFFLDLISARFPSFWIVYLPFATAANVLLFDELIHAIDFGEIHKSEGTSKSLYVLALTILSAGFAIATAVFLR